MKIVKKGMYGYRRWHQFRLMASGILLGLVMYFLFMLSLRISKLPRNAMLTHSASKIAAFCSTTAFL